MDEKLRDPAIGAREHALQASDLARHANDRARKVLEEARRLTSMVRAGRLRARKRLEGVLRGEAARDR